MGERACGAMCNVQLATGNGQRAMGERACGAEGESLRFWEALKPRESRAAQMPGERQLPVASRQLPVARCALSELQASDSPYLTAAPIMLSIVRANEISIACTKPTSLPFSAV